MLHHIDCTSVQIQLLLYAHESEYSVFLCLNIGLVTIFITCLWQIVMAQEHTIRRW